MSVLEVFNKSDRKWGNSFGIIGEVKVMVIKLSVNL